MNIELWIAIVVLLVIAFAIILPPLWRKKTLQESDVAEQNIAIAKQKLDELKNQLHTGNINQQQYEQQLLELETALDDDLSLSQTDKKPEKQGRWMIVVIAVLVPVVVVTMYRSLGDPGALNRSRVQQTSQAQQSKQQIGSVDAMVAGLAERMQKNPDDVEGWVMLGRSYKYMKKFDKSAQAYAKAYALNKDDANVMLQYADALVMTNQGRFSEQSLDLIFRAVALVPEDSTALWLAGIAKAETGDLVQGVTYLHQAQNTFPVGSESYQELSNYINSAISHMSEQQKQQVQAIADAQTQQKESVSVTTGIQVKVNLASTLSSQVHADDTVFVYATALSGPQMPLAIVRKQVKDLPFQVQLSDAEAMSPQMTLSNFKQVVVTARVSKSGKAIRQPDDLIGFVKPVSVSTQEAVNIVINGRVDAASKQPKAAAKVTQEDTTSDAAMIKISVNLSPEMQSRVSPNDTLFIYAKALSGPPMPLAIVRKQVKDLPLQIGLSDAQAMSPAMKLSGFDRVQVIARISKSGQARQQAGDLVASENNVLVNGRERVALVINQIVK